MKEFKKNLHYYYKTLFDYYENSFFTSIYRLGGIIIFPIFKYLNPNFITLISFFLGLLALFFTFSNYQLDLNFIMIFFIMSYFLDFTDGIVARHQKKTSFNGRFIDGLCDIFVGGILHIIFFLTLFREDSLLFQIFCLITITLHPMQHLVMDRFSALARWINDKNNNRKIKPYHRNDFLGKYTKLIYDIQHICIWAVFFKLINLKIIVEIFFLFSFLASILSISIYLFLSNKYFSTENNQEDNHDK